VIGYPNTGKSSIINTLKGTKCCKTAPIPGETKVWQYVTLTKKIYLIDSPGVVYDVGDSEVRSFVVLGVSLLISFSSHLISSLFYLFHLL
jgi:ribosome biogenesis GTPase A